MQDTTQGDHEPRAGLNAARLAAQLRAPRGRSPRHVWLTSSLCMPQNCKQTVHRMVAPRAALKHLPERFATCLGQIGLHASSTTTAQYPSTS
eukprot:3544498-Pleurochrysis_carterae.AAC.3